MRLLLDEMYPPAIAEQLRAGGHDAEAVVARSELRSLADEDLFAVTQSERRSLVTENVADFARIADAHDARGALHHGVVFVSPSKYRRGDSSTIGRMVAALDDLLRRNPAAEPAGARHWL